MSSKEREREGERESGREREREGQGKRETSSKQQRVIGQNGTDVASSLSASAALPALLRQRLHRTYSSTPFFWVGFPSAFVF